MQSRFRFAACSILCLGLLFAMLSPTPAATGDMDERRISIGLRLFRTMLAADSDLPGKVNADGRLELFLVSSGNAEALLPYVDELQESGRGEKKGTIRDIPIQVEIIAVADLSGQAATPPSGIFIAGELADEELKSVVDYGIRNHVIIYSPFEGDVEKGVLGGIFIGARVLPRINKQTLELSGIRIKDLFLRVAKLYE